MNERDDTKLFNCQHFRAVILWRALTSGVALGITLAVLVIILLARRSKAWENLPKRVLLGVTLSTGAYFLSALVGVDYTHQYLRGRHRAVCQGLGYLLNYTGTLVVVFYSAWVLVHLFHTTLPVLCTVLPHCDRLIESKLKKTGLKIKRMGEVLLFIFLFTCPAFLNTWEPFMSQVTSYGSYGPWCWFEQPLPTNCSNHTDWYNEDALYLVAIPYTGALFLCLPFILCITIAWCGLYIKFHSSLVGNRIAKVIPIIILLLIVASLTTVVLLTTAVQIINSKRTHQRQSMSLWITDAAENITITTTVLIIVAFFQHFPVFSCGHKFISIFKNGRNSNKPTKANIEGDPSYPKTVRSDQNAGSTTYYTAWDTFSCDTDQERETILHRPEDKRISYGTYLERYC